MEIPSYPHSRPLELLDKPMFDRLFDELQPRVSELSFGNLYLFRKAHNYRVSLVGESVVIFGRSYLGEPYFLPPCGNGVEAALAQLLGERMTLYGADERFMAEHLQGGDMEVTEDRDSFDYLYLRKDLAELPGNRYHKKKNRINYFAGRHQFAIETYNSGHQQGCLRLLDEWRRVRQEMQSPSLSEEVEAAAEALRMAESLGLQGLVAIVEGEVKAFVFGEQLNRDTSVCHFEKADLFFEGLYQLIDREFCRRLFTGCTYVNREQDLGEPNLREAKLSYHPVELVKKFRVRLISRNHSNLTSPGMMIFDK